MTTPCVLRCSVAALLCAIVPTLDATQGRTADQGLTIRVGLIGGAPVAIAELLK